MNELLFDTSLDVIKCIQKGRYDSLEKQQCLEQVSKEYIEKTIEDYGGVLDVVNEAEYLKSFQYIKIKNQDKYMTYLDLIIDGERSDLTLICEIEIINNRVVKIIVNDLHIL